ncbi:MULTISPECIES: GH3 family domain-containing protein [Roseivirga]|uniref:GH3 auxin-responsive promoter n=1 Tax=Roseivirga spongicola TaxID=333140 RepID=A0A150XAE0_9BACT|nr:MULTISPECIES: GH3 auxin-responsive promoter family protein [Roseivirga]KYG75695.1 GH3 auxin-responsive promoter [Roseivirga spongicola]MBO6662461.1 GH3 auxin-responsive promoter family protein [Roseivirga sp.]MBO6762174.1 GH3 auxin-responsive promoter family protein [Roseivirga sp.]MBO6909975.1 GH3 auxin-responsive promoter family protein [Roseivirga sp.]WPZ10741.1 GH3 auxin-responsive promoter family protein [Roseivirga spongicola]
MPIIGSILKKGIKLRETLEQDYTSPYDLQKKELSKLLISARNTMFGREYDFMSILEKFRSHGQHDFYEQFKANVPIHDYDSMNDNWWHKTRDGEPDISWPGKTKFFALSSGTSGASSKFIPVTKDMIRQIRKTGTRHIYTLGKYDLPDKFFQSGMLMLGGSTSLNFSGNFYYGDLSGITTGQLPLWIQGFSRPSPKIKKQKDWETKLEEIVENAHKWNIGMIAGVPAWVTILMERIIEKHGVKNIHEIWPNLHAYVHGGVAFEPYRKGFDKLLGHPIHFIETYLASEGFIAFQDSPDKKSMRLMLNGGIFHEFVPFNEKNFDDDGHIRPDAEALMFDQTEENKEYALLISTVSGAWRYMIGDTVKVVDKHNSEIIITGRTKHFLSLCGEHLSVDNMNKAVQLAANDLDIIVKEFTVAGLPDGSLFAHHWYVGVDGIVDQEILKEKIDTYLKDLNDDYAVERQHALKNIYLEVLPNEVFYGWMKSIGKEGGQTKFPRVLKKEKLESWLSYLKQEA